MSGQQVISNFIEESLVEAKARLDELKNKTVEEHNIDELEQDIQQAESDFALLSSIEALFDKGQLTEKRLLDHLKQLREV
ncbi:MAG: hypothetical protein Q8L64_00635 [bacterium]|nr:hypothetical protein [bacterium]